jgi:hypothetical protein
MSIHSMSTTKAIADDYYINRLSNAKIFENHGLERLKSVISQERIFERLPAYVFKEYQCCHCGGEMVSTYVSKSATLASEPLSTEVVSKAVQSNTLVRLEAKPNRRSWWQKDGTAYRVDGGHRVSAPGCALCGHQLAGKCECSQCVDLKNKRASEAAQLLYKELVRHEPDAIGELTCNGMLPLFKELSSLVADAARTDPSTAFGALDFKKKATLMLMGVGTPTAGSLLSAIQMVSINEYSVAWHKIRYRVQSTETLVQSVDKLKLAALNLVRSDLGAINVLGAWEVFALEEAVSVLEHYCDVHDINCFGGEHMITSIKRSLNLYGLAQTARYINNAVWNSRKYSSEQGVDRNTAYKFIYGNLNFWIDDSRARTYNAPPFRRAENVLCEPEDVSTFATLFLEQNGISYFTDPISMDSILGRGGDD